ncbi:hypothetical protein [Ginsengibacter hankyongi]|uniref:hypothetical protein n=1 Tax=Ginsengibacter hankyongi TaxID=2607284 RepID=UPI001926A9DC|nr:hypothetical protein [Ginsengibacter hankyongi]
MKVKFYGVRGSVPVCGREFRSWWDSLVAIWDNSNGYTISVYGAGKCVKFSCAFSILKLWILFKIRFRDGFPHAMGQATMKYLPYKVDGPDDVMNNGQYDGMIVIPAYQHRIDAQYKVDNAPVPVSHEKCFCKM